MTRRPSRRAAAGQWLLLLAVVAAVWALLQSAEHNLAQRNMSLGFGFLGDPAGFDIPFHLVTWTTFDTYGRALLVCSLNALLVSAMGIVASTVLGLLIGIMRLSANWLVRNTAVCFIELIRNTPQLVQIVFWYAAVLQALPSARQSLAIPGGILLNIRGLYLPRVITGADGPFLPWLALLVLAATPFAWRLRIGGARVGIRALVLPLLAAGLFLVDVDHVEWPALKGFNIAGGIGLPPELVALWAGLSIYSAAFIAEIVRSSIQAVPRGQQEAALSLGLKPAQRLLLIVLPQALRLMVPPLTSQYLNLIKNSSLGAAIAYPEIFEIFAGTVLNQSGREIETIGIVMVIFLVINLLTSAFMNWYNRRVAMVGR